ncbi:MAG: hypothetical protein J5990_05685 [Bacteroidales bacterium]|nr:hypothetical protein [Bacteroidales bacterium]
MKTSGQNRINVLDALRGFSLLGVILIHLQQHYSYFSFNPMLLMGQPEPSGFDIWVSGFCNNVIMGKFFRYGPLEWAWRSATVVVLTASCRGTEENDAT